MVPSPRTQVISLPNRSPSQNRASPTSLATTMDPPGSAAEAQGSSLAPLRLWDTLERAEGDGTNVPSSPLDKDMQDPDERLQAEIRRAGSQGMPQHTTTTFVLGASPAMPTTPGFGHPANAPVPPAVATHAFLDASSAVDVVSPTAYASPTTHRRWGHSSPAKVPVAAHVASIEGRNSGNTRAAPEAAPTPEQSPVITISVLSYVSPTRPR